MNAEIISELSGNFQTEDKIRFYSFQFPVKCLAVNMNVTNKTALSEK